MQKRILSLLLLSLIVLGSAYAEGTSEVESYPTRAVTVICPWGAGGGTDAVARIVAQQLQEKLGQPFNVVNRTGGNGAVGHSAVATAKEDGYTLGLVTTELGMLHWLGLADITYENVEPIALVNTDPAAIFVRADSPFESLEELEEAIRNDTGTFQASGASVGGIWHVSMVGWLQSAELEPTKVKWVPSQGAAPALQDLVAGSGH